MKSFEYYKKIFTDNNLEGDDRSLLVTRDLFESHHKVFSKNEEWNAFLQSLGKEKVAKLIRLVWFYYHLVEPYDDPTRVRDIRDEVRLIAIISIIEALMSDEEYKTFPQWYRHKYKTNFIADLKTAEEEYSKDFGSAKKFLAYVKKYFDEEDRDSLIDDINPIAPSVGPKAMNIKEIANFFYDMRSDFVHRAEMRTFCPPNAVWAGLIVGGKPYWTILEIEEVIDIFEKSFVKFWLSQV